MARLAQVKRYAVAAFKGRSVKRRFLRELSPPATTGLPRWSLLEVPAGPTLALFLQGICRQSRLMDLGKASPVPRLKARHPGRPANGPGSRLFQASLALMVYAKDVYVKAVSALVGRGVGTGMPGVGRCWGCFSMPNLLPAPPTMPPSQ